MKRLPLIAWLTVVWVALWGSVTAANVLGGLVAATVLAVALPLTDLESRGIVRPLALLRFLGYFVVDLVKSSLEVVRLVLAPRISLRQAVVAVPVRGASDSLLTLLANAISLTPGTLTLEVDRPRSTLYVHVIDVGDDVDAVRTGILHVERLAILAVGSAEARAALEQEHPHAPIEPSPPADRRHP